MSKAPAFQFYANDFMEERKTCAELGMASDVFGPPTCPGIYAVVVRNHDHNSADHVLYVGSARHIRSRVSQPDHPYQVAYRRFTPSALVVLRFKVCDDYLSEEIEAIKSLRPRLNVHHNGKTIR